MLLIYGSDQCPDCVKCKADLDRAGVAYEYRHIGENLLYLKEFLKLRDREPVFLPVKQAGSIGIPCILDGEETISLEWEQYL